MDIQGYLIVVKPVVLLRKYEAYVTRAHGQLYRELREGFTNIDPTKYRGTDRDPLSGYDEWMTKSLRKAGADVKIDHEAKVRMWDILSPLQDPDDTEQDFDLFQSLQQALVIYPLLDEPINWEIIRVRRINFTDSKDTIGFDIGYWGGDHFSLICDTVIHPTWHPPHPDDFVELKDKLSNLNENLLFNSPDDAKEFRKYYLTKDWAEKEDYEGQFVVIQVEEVNIAQI